jgi:hypothetical protein
MALKGYCDEINNANAFDHAKGGWPGDKQYR